MIFGNDTGRFATPTALRPASACDSPVGNQDNLCQIKF